MCEGVCVGGVTGVLGEHAGEHHLVVFAGRCAARMLFERGEGCRQRRWVVRKAFTLHCFPPQKHDIGRQVVQHASSTCFICLLAIRASKTRLADHMSPKFTVMS